MWLSVLNESVVWRIQFRLTGSMDEMKSARKENQGHSRWQPLISLSSIFLTFFFVVSTSSMSCWLVYANVLWMNWMPANYKSFETKRFQTSAKQNHEWQTTIIQIHDNVLEFPLQKKEQKNQRIETNLICTIRIDSPSRNVLRTSVEHCTYTHQCMCVCVRVHIHTHIYIRIYDYEHVYLYCCFLITKWVLCVHSMCTIFKLCMLILYWQCEKKNK